MPRIEKDVALGAALHRAARIHHHHPVGEFGDHPHVVGDEYDGRLVIALQLADQVENLRLHGDIERRGRLVGDQQGRIARQRHGDHRALPHAARELVRIAVRRLLGVRDIHLGEKVDRPGAGRRLSDSLMRQDLFDDLPADRIDRRQRRHRVLEDHGDLAPPQLPHFAWREPHEFAAAIGDRARDERVGIGDEPHHGEQRQRLARSGLSHHAEDFALLHVEGHAVDWGGHTVLGAERNAQIADRKHHAVLTRGSSRI